jgi:hypothetical protein
MSDKAVIDNVYHYIWTQMNWLDVMMDDCTNENYGVYKGMREAYWNVLAHLDPEAAADRIRSYGERERLRGQ